MSLKMDYTLCVFLFFACVMPNFGYSEKTKRSIESVVPIEDYITEMGYPVETHDIQTDDGYILTYHRIPHGKLSNANGTRPPVLVQHGILAVSRVWVAVNNSIGFLLADAGYDVWLANARGTYYSRKHIKYDPDKDKKKFWDFSWHEMGYYDLPAGIDYILQQTGQSQLSYVAHSMGTTLYFVLGATRPDYMSKISVSALMAPVGKLQDMRSYVFNFFYKFKTPIILLTEIFRYYEFLPYNNFVYWLVETYCKPGRTQILCKDVIGIICGFDNQELDSDQLTENLNFMPGGTSTKAVIHYGQIINKDFSQYDYGLWKNIAKYHSLHPPKYNLANVTAPTYFFLGPNDWIVSPSVAISVAKQLPNLQGLTLVANPDFSHGDFMWAKDVKTLVNDEVIATIKKYL